MTELDSIQLSTNTNDVRKEAEELKELIQQVRSRIDLPPIFKAKKRCFEQLNNTDESSLPSKKMLLEDDNVELSKIDSREDLMTRLSSYSTNFHLIQRPVTALECAKHGWKDTNKATEKEPDTCVLSCDTCGNNIFVIAIKCKASEKVVNEVKKRYEAGLYNGHKESCQWRTQKCDDGVYCFPLVTIESGLEKFKTDANNIISACVKEKRALPTLCHEVDDRTLIKVKYFAEQTQNEHVELESIETAYILSLYGWELLHADIPGVKCDLCCTRKAFYLLNEPFDVLRRHKSYCPYVNAETANAYTPKGFSLRRTQKISGSDWMKDVLSLEYVILIKTRDLSLTYEDALDEKIRKLQNNL
ncbi:hypothetical protein HPULCUR_011654 [Helicostylum pulchrum]|uniref:C3HC-type domain-containing protein n=1 Tax=Helicostylum pulchrum TaxID=562976 RepID=A0ABP9YGZ1_9FUNG